MTGTLQTTNFMGVIMKYIRKSLSITLIVVILFISAYSDTFSYSNPNTIYETSTTEKITSGATLEKITRFTVNGWQSINVLTVDLSNPFIKVDTLYDSSSIKKYSTTQALAKSSGAVAAINASFFEPGQEEFYGPAVKSESIDSTYSGINSSSDILATFSIDKLNQAFYSYWKSDISLITPTGEALPVGSYNRTGWDYSDLNIIDRKWGENSIGVNSKYKDIVEMVVDNGIVTEIRTNQPQTKIPLNGFIVTTRVSGGNILKANFQIGDPVSFDITTTPDWNNLKMAVTGGAMLVVNGKVPSKFSHNADGLSKQPRTGIASSEDGKQLMLVTVDGRQQSSVGMTQNEFADLMLELGAYNALNFDGGSSTTMVARHPGDESTNVVNNPSGGFVRSIATAIGVFSIAPPTELAGLTIGDYDPDTFINTSKGFSVKGYDKYLNPIQVDADQVKWSVKGVKGTFKKNIFYPTSVGPCKIYATIGNVTSDPLELSVLSSPVQLELNQKSVNLSSGQSVDFSVVGINKNGYRSALGSDDLKWSVKGTIGSIKDGKFTASGKGAGYIDAYIGSTHAYCTVSVATDSKKVIDVFETKNGSFASSNADTIGKYEISTANKHSGKSSGKLTYKFPEKDDSRAAYLILQKDGITLDPTTKKIGLWVYNIRQNPNSLNVWIYDSKNKLHYVSLAKAMDWTGWKYVETTLDGIDSPSKLSRIYLVQTSSVLDSGSVYFDDLTVTTTSYPKLDASKILQDSKPVDLANKSPSNTKSTDLFKFSVFAQTNEPASNAPTQKTLLAKLSDKINSSIDAAAFVGSTSHNIVSSVKKPYVSTNTGYKSFDIKNSRFIQLDMSKGGIRQSDSTQWFWFLKQLDSFAGDNLFVFLAGSPGSFSDNLEGTLFKDILSQFKKKTSKNAWVFFQGAQNASYMEKGIKYISTAGFDVPGFTAKTPDEAKYILVTVKGSTITYQFKPI
jgi:exopolysaccharide biosynthesis protein